MSSATDRVDDPDVRFLMEKLLDEQEKVALLQEEVERYRSTAALRDVVDTWAKRNAASVVGSAVKNSSDEDQGIEALLSLRTSLVSSLQHVDAEIARIRGRAAPHHSHEYEGKPTENDEASSASLFSAAAAEDEQQQQQQRIVWTIDMLRREVLRFHTAQELEETYRVGIRIAYDAPRVLSVALDKLDKLTNGFSILESSVVAESGTQPSLIPSFCQTMEWQSQFRKSLLEVVLAFDMKQPSSTDTCKGGPPTTVSARAAHTQALLARVAQHQKSIIDLLRATKKNVHQPPSRSAASSTSATGTSSNRTSPAQRSVSPYKIPTLQSIRLPPKEGVAASTTRSSSAGRSARRDPSPLRGKETVHKSHAGSASPATTTTSLPPRAPPISTVPPTVDRSQSAPVVVVEVPQQMLSTPRVVHVEPRSADRSSITTTGSRQGIASKRSTVPTRVTVRTPSPVRRSNPDIVPIPSSSHVDVVGSSSSVSLSGIEETRPRPPLARSTCDSPHTQQQQQRAGEDEDDDAAWDRFVEEEVKHHNTQHALYESSPTRSFEKPEAVTSRHLSQPDNGMSSSSDVLYGSVSAPSPDFVSRRRQPQEPHTAAAAGLSNAPVIVASTARQVRFVSQLE